MVETNGMKLPAASLGQPDEAGQQAQIETALESVRPASPADAFALNCGQELGGYRIVRRLGSGGMGTVYEAEQMDSGRRVALKVLGRSLISKALRSRFLREGQIAARVTHPNLVYVFGTEEIGQTPVITMELMAGGTLDDKVRLHGPMPIASAVDAILQVIEGLEAAAAVDVLHRDIKPSNCFIAPDGTVKVGDFGLSVTTCSSDEANLTQEDCYLGTPAFCSPEQIRGDKLDVRSDLYSVGGTLYFLLTGQSPFQAASMVRLLSKVLEREPQPLPQLRAEIPQELAQVVMRCLAKHPDARFSSYGELRNALRPFSSTPMTPARLSLRFLAWAIDVLFLAMVGMLLSVTTFFGPLARLNQLAMRPAGLFSMSVLALVWQVLYFALPEYFWRATPGKAICQVRIASTGRRFTIIQALIRSGLFVLLPQLPFWIMFGLMPAGTTSRSISIGLSMAMAIPHYLLLLLMLSTMRRRNGYAAVHDLISDSRVVARSEYQARPRGKSGMATQVADNQTASIGPYRIIGPMDGNSSHILLARDPSLGRCVWIRQAQPEQPPVSASLRCLCRPGRLHWLNGKRSPEQSWDAYEAVSGSAFAALAGQRQPWKLVRYWLSDLADELHAAAQDGTFPATLRLDRIWIDAENRAKLLDFPLHERVDSGEVEAIAVTPGSEFAAAREFLVQVAASALEGGMSCAREGQNFPVPLPLHARKLLDNLPSAPDWGSLMGELRGTLQKPAAVTSRSRLGLLSASLILPVVMTLAIILAQMMMEQWNSMNPDVPSLARCLRKLETLEQNATPSASLQDERKAMEIYISTRYRSLILDNARWDSPVMQEILTPDQQRLAEEALARHPRPSPEEIRAATDRLKPFINSLARWHASGETFVAHFGTTILLGTIVIFVMVPAMGSALLFGGGVLMRSLGIAVVNRQGAPASRPRVFLRVFIAWLPVLLLEILLLLEVRTKTPLRTWLDFPLMIILVGGTVISIIIPHRGIQDRLAGTFLVPR